MLTLICSSSEQTFEVHQHTDLGKLVGDLRFVVAAVLGLLEADHHQILKKVLTTDVPWLPGCVVSHRHARRLYRLGVSDSYAEI